MNERIRQLEDALAILQARCFDEPHLLLRGDIIVAKTEQEDENRERERATQRRDTGFVSSCRRRRPINSCLATRIAWTSSSSGAIVRP